MKYSVEQIEEALKGGKSIQYSTSQNENFSCRYDVHINQVVISVTHLICGHPGLNVDLKFLLKCFELNILICTKIEGEETMTNKPHKHAELIKKWADGAVIQLRQCNGEWVNTAHNDPSWGNEFEYRIKPNLVKKWKWVYRDLCGVLDVTDYCYTDQEFKSSFRNLTLIQKIDSTMIEVEE